jgi:hypothetical protein
MTIHEKPLGTNRRSTVHDRLMSEFGRDPEVGSGPLATVVQDLLLLLIYFAIASAVLGEANRP